MSPDDNGYHQFGKRRAHKWWRCIGSRGAPALLVGPWKASRPMDEDRHKTQALYISAPRQSVTTYFRYLSFGACFNKCQLIWLYKEVRTGSGCLWGRWKGRLFEGRLAPKYKDVNTKTGALAYQYKEFYMKTGRHCLPVGQSRHVTGISY